MIDIIIVNWNGGRLIEDCVLSLREIKKTSLSFNVVVVDNSSSDGSPLFLSQQNDITFLQNNANEGFGRACNQGAKLGNAKYILFLNPDTQVNSDIFSPLITFMEQENKQRIGACGIKLIDASESIARSCARFPSLYSSILNSLGLDRISWLRSHGIHMAEWNHKDSRNVDHVIGAFYFIKRDIFEKLAGFDENFFVYYEDLDISRRLTNLGYKLRYLSNLSAKHIGGGTTDTAKALRTFLSMRSKFIYARKHFSSIQFLIYLPFVLVCEPMIRTSAAIFAKGLKFAEERNAFVLLWRWILFHRQNCRWMP